MTHKNTNSYIWTVHTIKEGSFFSLFQGLYFKYTYLVCINILNGETDSMPISIAVYFGDPVYE